MSSERLLGPANSTWTPKILGTLIGACAACALVASTSSSSLFTAPTIPAVTQTTTVIGQQASLPRTVTTLGAASAVTADTQPRVETEYAQSSTSWSGLAAVVAIPTALVGALAALRSKKTVTVLDPIDMTNTGHHWAMVATSGENAIAKNYASALIELGQEGKCLEQLHADMDNFGSILSDESFASFFNNPMMLGPKQKEMIAKICDESSMSPITKNFLSFLVDKRRIMQLPGIIREFDEQFYDVTGTQVATVTAAVPMNEEQLRLIANKLHEMTKGRNIKIKSEVDPELLAGFILEYGKSGSQRIDLSLRGQLNELQADLKENIRSLVTAGVPAAIHVATVAVGINALLAGHAEAKSGNIFDFGMTMPVQMLQFVLLMVFLEKTVFTPVGKVLDDRAAYIRERNSAGADNSKEIKALNAQAEELLDAARRDAAKEQERAKKEAAALAAKKMNETKAEMESSVKRSLAEIQRSKDELWTKLEEEVLPQLADDICNKLLQEEPAAATAKQ